MKHLSEQQFYAMTAERIRKGDVDPARHSISLEEAMGEEAHREYLGINAIEIAETTAMLESGDFSHIASG